MRRMKQRQGPGMVEDLCDGICNFVIDDSESDDDETDSLDSFAKDRSYRYANRHRRSRRGSYHSPSRLRGTGGARYPVVEEYVRSQPSHRHGVPGPYSKGTSVYGGKSFKSKPSRRANHGGIMAVTSVPKRIRKQRPGDSVRHYSAQKYQRSLARDYDLERRRERSSHRFLNDRSFGEEQREPPLRRSRRSTRDDYHDSRRHRGRY